MAQNIFKLHKATTLDMMRRYSCATLESLNSAAALELLNHVFAYDPTGGRLGYNNHETGEAALIAPTAADGAAVPLDIDPRNRSAYNPVMPVRIAHALATQNVMPSKVRMSVRDGNYANLRLDNIATMLDPDWGQVMAAHRARKVAGMGEVMPRRGRPKLADSVQGRLKKQEEYMTRVLGVLRGAGLMAPEVIVEEPAEPAKD